MAVHATNGLKADSVIAGTYIMDDLSSCFHISIGWTIDQPNGIMKQGLENLLKEEDICLGISVTALKIKIGNAVTSVSLAVRKKGDSDKGIL